METETAHDSGAGAGAGARRHQTLVGTVVKTGLPKTVTVAVVRRVQHPTYHRGLKRTKRYLAHDERGECQLGDEVLIAESRPLSARKRWRVRRIINRRPVAGR